MKMIKAVGLETGTTHAYASTKSELLMMLNRSYKYKGTKIGIYPEPLKLVRYG
jgi:putative ubiquitin-RnfH superfamily antitoxin RatB of RatAB toxin-antitoxin module